MCSVREYDPLLVSIEGGPAGGRETCGHRRRCWKIGTANAVLSEGGGVLARVLSLQLVTNERRRIGILTSVQEYAMSRSEPHEIPALVVSVVEIVRTPI